MTTTPGSSAFTLANLLIRPLVVVVTVATAGCAWLLPRPAGVGEPVAWHALPGWEQDHHAEAWPALLHSCDKLEKKNDDWRALCRQARTIPAPDDARARQFFERWFVPHELVAERGRRDGLLTGYYEPLLHGSLKPAAGYPVPLYRRPDDLVTVDLGDLYPQLADKRVRGRLTGRRVVPYYSRAEINSGTNPLAGNELVWVDDPVAAFFLHIQGSGRVRLEDGRTLAVGYADQNGHPYSSIGRALVEQGEMALDEVNLFTIRAWLRANPDRAEALLRNNASYVFFELRDDPAPGPLGSLGVALTPERSLAIDPRFVDLGVPVWVDTTLPGEALRPYRRLLLAQDTGGAIKGAVRADIFFGRGEEAERLAGTMKQAGRLYVLLPISGPGTSQ